MNWDKCTHFAKNFSVVSYEVRNFFPPNTEEQPFLNRIWLARDISFFETFKKELLIGNIVKKNIFLFVFIFLLDILTGNFPVSNLLSFPHSSRNGIFLFKGAVSRDFLVFFYFMNRSHMGP